MEVNLPILIVAAVFLGLSIFHMSGDMAKLSTFQRGARISFGWLCAALASTLVIFSFFPTTAMSGQAFGFSLGGAAAFVLVILLAAPSLQRKISDLDTASSTPADHPAEIKELKYLSAQETFRYAIDGSPDRAVCIITGNINLIVDVDVWVNSENTQMRMSERLHETISGMIRLYGAERDAAGHIVKDIIADSLAEKVAGKTPVQPAVAIATGPGELRRSNNVRAIVHVAAVQVDDDLGHRQLPVIDTCVFNVLQEADRAAAEDETPFRSVVFPLFGTGSGRGDLESTARVMIDSAVSYLRRKEDSGIRDIYFSAWTNLAFEALHGAAKAAPGLKQEKKTGNTGRK
ncbi:MAG: hypothetical protein HOQ24_08945 [Mycobacteriaceae bacterium]|nr:hypothetical protein [Mycobacteriaceae bacterium]